MYLCGKFFDRKASQRSGLFPSSQLTESGDRRFDQRHWIVGTERLGQDVVNSASFANGSHGLPGDNSGTRPGGNERDLCGTELSPNLMRNGAFDERDVDHVSSRLLRCLLHAGGNFVCFSISPTDATLAVSDDDHGRKAEAAAAFHNRGATLDLDDAVKQAIVFRLFGLLLTAATTRLVVCSTNDSNPR